MFLIGYGHVGARDQTQGLVDKHLTTELTHEAEALVWLQLGLGLILCFRSQAVTLLPQAPGYYHHKSQYQTWLDFPSSK